MNKIIVLFAFLLGFGLQAQFNVVHSVYFDTDVYNLTKTEKDFYFNDSNHFKEQNLNQLDLKKSAFRQLLNENIPNKNIDISNLCTYKLKNEFNSWRRSKTISRQFNLICS